MWTEEISKIKKFKIKDLGINNHHQYAHVIGSRGQPILFALKEYQKNIPKSKRQILINTITINMLCDPLENTFSID